MRFSHLTVIYGTRPEAIKLTSVIRALKANGVVVRLIDTGQHPDLVPDLKPDCQLTIPHPDDPNQLVSVILDRLPAVLREVRTDGVIVQGDTASAMAGALAARVALIHVEAGIRSNDLAEPWPEEGYRREIDKLASWHFCATEGNAQNVRWRLGGELWTGAPPNDEQVFVTGNPGLDLLPPFRIHRQNRVMVTLHRREAFGDPLRRILQGLIAFATDSPKLEFLWPVHPNPHVLEACRDFVFPDNILRLPPLPGLMFQTLLAGSQAVLTDSGGVQEEAAFLGVPAVIARDKTDRPESVLSGHAFWAGRDPDRIREGLGYATGYGLLSSRFLGFGDGTAGEQIAKILAEAP